MPVTMAQDILIQNVTLISPERAAPMSHADVLLREGRIAQISTKAADDF
jgi:predicted amidohydrolase